VVVSQGSGRAGVLELDRVGKSFGGVFAVHDVTVRVVDGEVRGIIGANGAGKSTLFNLISGHLAADHGEIRYRGAALGRHTPHDRAHRGIAIVFQGARIFRGMTVAENVMVGRHAATRCGFVASTLGLPRQRAEEREIRDKAMAALQLVDLEAWAELPAESLPLGQQRRLQVARALCADPTLLLLDEPASGLRASERAALGDLIEQLHGDGLTMLLIEHDVSFVLRLADRITAMDLGEVVAEGDPHAVIGDPKVMEAYLGREVGDAGGL
jgi:branched-chain amino acid transport system ATP-binding protein